MIKQPSGEHTDARSADIRRLRRPSQHVRRCPADRRTRRLFVTHEPTLAYGIQPLTMLANKQLTILTPSPLPFTRRLWVVSVTDFLTYLEVLRA
jgi:hypothetical protein